MSGAPQVRLKSGTEHIHGLWLNHSDPFTGLCPLSIPDSPQDEFSTGAFSRRRRLGRHVLLSQFDFTEADVSFTPRSKLYQKDSFRSLYLSGKGKMHLTALRKS